MAHNQAMYEDFPLIMRGIGLPLYWKKPVWDAVGRGQERVEQKEFSAWWRALTSLAHDEAARFVHILTRGSRSYLVFDDFESLIYDVIHSHPGLEFYRKSEEFHDKYIQVVTTRIFWCVNRSWSGRITCAELRRSNLLQCIRKLESTLDINQGKENESQLLPKDQIVTLKMTDYFSYEHFYVIYCKFWEIDQDHDLLISREDLSKHADRALPQLVVERIFSRAVTRGTRGGENTKLDVRRLTDFTTFLLADEDKKHPTSIEYWFRVMDLDGDGVISFYEMELFYDDLKKKLDECAIETMSFVDLTCNLIDMIKPSSQSGFKLSDLKKSHLAVRFFNSFVNWRKFYEQEATEGEKATLRGQGEDEISDWDKYCLEEYENLIEDDIDENFDVNLDEEDNNIIKEEVLHNDDSQSSCSRSKKQEDNRPPLTFVK